MALAVSDVRSAGQLRDLVDAGGQPKYLMFWGAPSPGGRRGGEGCLSQWWPAPFAVDGVVYPTAEHFMMAGKALVFSDVETAEKVARAPHPGAAKALGRQVRSFDEQVWAKHRFGIVVAGNLAKFSQHPELGRFLLAAGERVLVEASPRDQVWGIGLTADDERAASPHSWRGLNLLGFALMEVRHRLNDTAAQARPSAG